MTLAKYIEAGHFLFLYTFLNLGHADYNYRIEDFHVVNHVVTANISSTPSTHKYVLEQKARRVRVAYNSLIEYSAKENRNGLNITLAENAGIVYDTIDVLNTAGDEYTEWNERLMRILREEVVLEQVLRSFVADIPDISKNECVKYARNQVQCIMENIAHYLADNWDNLRYSRDLSE
jgi:hypothetical protein